MPIYEFKCEDCQATIEVTQKISDPYPESCEKCGSKGKLHKLMSQTSFVLKGGGWYNEAYSSTKKASAAPAASASTADSSKAESSSSSETKTSEPAATTTTPEKKHCPSC